MKCDSFVIFDHINYPSIHRYFDPSWSSDPSNEPISNQNVKNEEEGQSNMGLLPLNLNNSNSKSSIFDSLDPFQTENKNRQLFHSSHHEWKEFEDVFEFITSNSAFDLFNNYNSSNDQEEDEQDKEGEWTNFEAELEDKIQRAIIHFPISTAYLTKRGDVFSPSFVQELEDFGYSMKALKERNDDNQSEGSTTSSSSSSKILGFQESGISLILRKLILFKILSRFQMKADQSSISNSKNDFVQQFEDELTKHKEERNKKSDGEEDKKLDSNNSLDEESFYGRDMSKFDLNQELISQKGFLNFFLIFEKEIKLTLIFKYI